MNYKKCFIAAIICGAFVLSGNDAMAQKKRGTKKSKGNSVEQIADSTKKVSAVKKGIPTIKEFIKSGTVVHKGLFNVYVQNDSYFVEIPDQLLGREIMIFSSIVKGSAQKERSAKDFLGYAGDALNSRIICFEKGVKDRLYIKEPVFSFILPDSTSDMYGSVSSSNMTPIAESFDIKARGENSVIIDFTEMYKGDHPYFSIKDQARAKALRVGTFQPEKSYPTTISAFENNMIFRSVKSYAAGAPEPSNPKAEMNPTIWEIASSWYLLPEKPMTPRSYDTRVGYFMTTATDYTKDQSKAVLKDMVSRWRLEPKAEDIEKFKRGELVEPEKPIIFYVDRDTPEYLRSYIISGVNSWQKSFEKIGFKNAIIGKMAPTKEEDPNFSPEDARYSFISYKASPIPNAYGPHVADPRTGEIINAHVAIFHNVLSLAQAWYFAQCAAVDPRARTFPLSDELMGELMHFIVAHEVGHSLGLRHNFAGSWTHSIAELRDNEFIAENSHGSTIMDYMRFNYVAQPKDNIDPKNLIPKQGAYDHFAIAWGYKYLPDMSEKEQNKYMVNWTTEQRKADKRVYFGTETDRLDPRLQAEDLGDNAMKAGELGIENLKLIMKNIEKWSSTAEDENYTRLKELYGAVRSQYWRYINHVMKNIAGRYQDAFIRSEQGYEIYKPVSAADQREAMAFLNKYFFTDQPWLLNGRVADLTGFDGDAYKGRAAAQVLAKVFGMCEVMIKNETLTGGNTYTVKNMMDDIYSTIFSKVASKTKLSTFERSLQAEYVKILTKVIKVLPPEKAPEFINLAFSKMEMAARQMRQQAKSATDPATKNHLTGLAIMVDSWLSGGKESLL